MVKKLGFKMERGIETWDYKGKNLNSDANNNWSKIKIYYG